MKQVFFIIAAALTLSFTSCKDKDKDETPGNYKIHYQVIGDGVEEIKFNANDINYSVKRNFANGWDTTFVHTTKQKLQLQAKAKSSSSANLTGVIYLNNIEVAKQVDEAKDADGKYDVKLEFQIQ